MGEAPRFYITYKIGSGVDTFVLGLTRVFGCGKVMVCKLNKRKEERMDNKEFKKLNLKSSDMIVVKKQKNGDYWFGIVKEVKFHRKAESWEVILKGGGSYKTNTLSVDYFHSIKKIDDVQEVLDLLNLLLKDTSGILTKVLCARLTLQTSDLLK